MGPRQRFETMDAYLASVPPEARLVLENIRQAIKTAVPGAAETIGYQMPAFKLQKIFIYFASFKSHIGVYPPLHSHLELQAALEPYRGPKGNLKFPLDQPVPYELIARLAQALAEQGG